MAAAVTAVQRGEIKPALEEIETAKNKITNLDRFLPVYCSKAHLHECLGQIPECLLQQHRPDNTQRECFRKTASFTDRKTRWNFARGQVE